MNNYDLQFDEVLIHEGRYTVETSDRKGKGPQDIAITNKNIIILVKGLFGGVKEIRKYPISSVKQFDGKAALRFDEKILEGGTLTISLTNCEMRFSFSQENKKYGRDIANTINKLVTGSEENIVQSAVPGMDIIADTLKGTLDVFKKSFSTPAGKKSIVCPGCNADIVGTVGSVISCQYCGKQIHID